MKSKINTGNLINQEGTALGLPANVSSTTRSSALLRRPGKLGDDAIASAVKASE